MVRSNMGVTTSFSERRVWGSAEDAGAGAAASSTGTREAMPPRSPRRSGRWTGGEKRGRIAALVAVVLVLLLGISRAQHALWRRAIAGRLSVLRRAPARAQGHRATPRKRSVIRTKASLGVALWPVGWVCVPNSEAAFRPSTPAFCGGQGRPPRMLSAARATEHRMSRPPSPGDGWLGPFRAAFAENAPQLEVYFLAPGIGRGGPFPVLK